MDRFIALPYRLHASDPNWVPPLLMERRETLSPKTNPYFLHADVMYFLALRGDNVVGRISAQIDHAGLELRQDATGHFGLLAAEDDQGVVDALFAAAADWLRSRGMVRMVGPFNLSINEETGLLVEGWDRPPMLMMGHDLAYLGPRVEAAGLVKAKDVYAYLYDIQDQLPKAVRTMIERPLPADLRVRMLDMARYDQELESITSIFNNAWSGNWGFVPLSAAETKQMAKSLKLLINPRLAWIAEVGGRPVAFGVCLPNLNEAIADLGGKLFPLGIIKLLWRLKVKGVKTARVPLMGVRRDVGGWLQAVLPFLIVDNMRLEARKLGYQWIELSWILEDNRPMRRIIEAIGSNRYKTYRLYERAV
ncbi:dATP pyrophosphohydrolase [Niveispirillum lacus]|uniref:dATP pyrophosphohydrolase n=2 Tax=Niveispirillum lacus TaxID=1981099 RepID=A0A255YX88_9PROT|nr:dATP pyrophosphohydrolase [Niveispirillum lacus]